MEKSLLITFLKVVEKFGKFDKKEKKILVSNEYRIDKFILPSVILNYAVKKYIEGKSFVQINSNQTRLFLYRDACQVL